MMGGERCWFQVVARLEGFQFDESVSDGDGLVPESTPHWQFRLVKYDKSIQISGTETKMTCYANMFDVSLSELG